MVQVILLCGVQGSGKSWVYSRLIDKYDLKAKKKAGLIRLHTDGRVWIAGIYNGETFQGSDRLSMACMKDYDLLLGYLSRLNNSTIPPVFLLLEGDRFTNSKVIDHPLYKPIVIKITDDGEKGRERRGSIQSEGAIKRMKTRIDNVKATIEVENSDKALDTLEKLIRKGYE